MLHLPCRPTFGLISPLRTVLAAAPAIALLFNLQELATASVDLRQSPWSLRTPVAGRA